MRSLTAKLTLASLCSSLISVALVGLFARYLTSVAFGDYVQDRTTDEILRVVTDYYVQNGTWNGIDDALHAPPPGFALFEPPNAPDGGNRPPPHDAPPNAPGGGDRPPPNNAPANTRGGNRPPPNDAPNDRPPARPYVVVNQLGITVTEGRGYTVGASVPAELLTHGIAVDVQGQRVGTILVANSRTAFDPREQDFLSRTNRALLAAMVGGGASALLIGIVLTRLLTRPIRALTTAIRAMQQGTLRQEVPSTSQDELGELVRAFNLLSHDLARANQARRQMTADIAHELRTPLSVLMGYIETMRDGILPPTQERFQTMFGEATQLQRLIDDLRLLSLADAGELPLHPQPIKPDELLSTISAAFAPQAAQQHIALHVEATAGLPALHVDRERIIQVLGNLVSNALRYTPRGGTIVLAAASAGAQTQLEVRDTGCGIAPNALASVFERLYRADASRGAEDGGSGLGLAITKAIVEAHGGTITATSTLGSGTRMLICLPVGSD